MRVLHIISGLDPQNGGPTAALIGLARAQASVGLDVTVMATWTIGDGLPVAEALRKDGIKVETIGPAKGKLSRHPDLAAAVDRQVETAEVVHVHAMWEEIQHRAARSARRRGVSYVIRPCGMLSPWSLNQSKWVKKVFLALRVRRNLEGAAALHFTTADERDASLKLSPPAIVEPNGVELREFAELPPKRAFRARYPQIGDRKLIVFLGRLHPGKGMEHLVPALAKCGDREAVLVAVGPDSENFRATLEAMVARHGLNDRVIFAGLLRGTDKVAALADADLFCLPSDHENFGVAIVEALAAGTPAIVSDHVGIWREIVAAGVGAAVKQDAEVLAAELSRWLGDDAMRRTAAQKARPFVWENYDWLKIARRWGDHYERLKRKASS